MDGFQKAMPLSCTPETQLVGAVGDILGQNCLLSGDNSSENTVQDRGGVPTFPRRSHMGTTHTPLRPGRSLSLSLTASCSRFSPARYCTTLSSPRDTPNKVRGSPGFLPIAPMGTPGAMARPDALVLSVQVPSATAQSPERIYRSMVSRLYLLLDLKGTVLLLDRLYSLIISQGFVYKDRPERSIPLKPDSCHT